MLPGRSVTSAGVTDANHVLQPDLVAVPSARSSEPEEHAGNVLRMRWAGGVGIVIWTFFVIFDWHLGKRIDGSDPIALLAIRLGVVPLQLVGLWRLLRSPTIGAQELRFTVPLLFSILSGALGWMASIIGGFYNPYDQGVYVLLMVQGAFLMQPWWQGWLPNLMIVLVHFAATIAAAWFHQGFAVQLDSSSGLLLVVGNHLAMLFAGAMMVMASHMAWALRRRVFQARQLGQYKLDVPIGEGGHGQVWRAFHIGMNVSVAVKILKGDWRPDSPQAQRFQREARATFALKHPNTVRMLDYGITVDGVCYLAMELLDGVTLAQLIARDGPLDQTRALHVVLQAADALSEAHSLGVVHRDVKPENLLITNIGHDADFCKLLDFGVARVSDEASPPLTLTGKVIGTPGYIAPEVLGGAQADPRADVYALGAVLHFALTGDAPHLFDFEGTEARSELLLDSVMGATVCDDLRIILGRCLYHTPARRFANAGELAEHLRRCTNLGSPEVTARWSRRTRKTYLMPTSPLEAD